MKNALVYFTGISRTAGHIGGSEILLFLIIRELQYRGYAVTVALQSGGDIEQSASEYGIDIDADKVQVVYLDECRGLLYWLNRHLKFLWKWRLRRLGPKFDVCISCANPVDFGRSGIHFVYMLNLDALFTAYYWRDCQLGGNRIWNWLLFARDYLAACIAGVRMPSRIVRDGKEVILANSKYVKECIESYYKCYVHDEFYPPTVFETYQLPMQDGYDIACLGRISFEKRILEIVQIVSRARQISGINFKLRLAGHCPDSDYGHNVRALADKNPWIKLEGTIVGKAKAEYLASCRFAIHGCKVEAFGISVTEYLKAGLVPIVPKAGGSSEVLGLADLIYNTDEEAVDILVKLATDDGFYRKCRAQCMERGNEFSTAAYMSRQRELLDACRI